VACAFGKKDVDEIYQNAILPVLESMQIKPYRVDQIEHNDDIDNKIIELILKCDICIADLTYSRPSVYYEAGYFNGLRKSVVFITRKDHFSPKTEDVYGNFKIHFDLQMKNIITWSSTNRVDTFKRKLLSRINFISKPLIQRIKKETIQEKSRLAFSKLSQKDKQLEIETQLLEFFKKRSLIVNRLILDYLDMWDIEDIKKSLLKNFDKSKKYLFSFITVSATKEYMKSIDKTNYTQIGHLESFKYVNRNILTISIRKVPRSRLEDMYPDAKPIVNGKVLEFVRPNNLKVRYLFISNIKSIEEFNKELEIISQELI
jgi:nucleoside 2-deoxyribosyltransferase